MQLINLSASQRVRARGFAVTISRSSHLVAAACYALRMRWLALSATLFASTAMAHGNNNAVLLVSAQVRPSAVIRLQVLTTSIAVTGTDLSRGYVEVPEEALLSMTAGKVKALVFLDSEPLISEGGAYRLDLRGRAATGGSGSSGPVILGIEL